MTIGVVFLTLAMLLQPGSLSTPTPRPTPTPTPRPTPTPIRVSFKLESALRSMRYLSDAAFASLVHWARSGATTAKVGSPAWSVEFELSDHRGLDQPDRQALLDFLRGGSRSALRARGASDSDIGSRNPANVAAPTPSPTPTPNPYRSLEFGSPTIGGDTAGKIVVLGGWAAVKRDGRGAHACISFKNTDSRTATRVLFQFPISDKSGAVLADLELDRRGTFSPDVDIIGWSSLENWQNGQHRGYSENCTSITTGVAALPLLTARFASYRILRVEYANGASWVAPATPSPSSP
jgi:hypothetical protein